MAADQEAPRFSRRDAPISPEVAAALGLSQERIRSLRVKRNLELGLSEYYADIDVAKRNGADAYRTRSYRSGEIELGSYIYGTGSRTDSPSDLFTMIRGVLHAQAEIQQHANTSEDQALELAATELRPLAIELRAYMEGFGLTALAAHDDTLAIEALSISSEGGILANKRILDTIAEQLAEEPERRMEIAEFIEEARATSTIQPRKLMPAWDTDYHRKFLGGLG